VWSSTQSRQYFDIKYREEKANEKITEYSALGTWILIFERSTLRAVFKMRISIQKDER